MKAILKLIWLLAAVGWETFCVAELKICHLTYSKSLILPIKIR